MMTSESCQCEIPRQPHTAGRYGAYHGRFTSGLAGVTAKGPFPFSVTDNSYLEPIGSAPVLDIPNTWEGNTVANILAPGTYPIKAASYETTPNNVPKAAGDLDARWYLIADPDTNELMGWVKAVRLFRAADGQIIETTYALGHIGDAPADEAEMQQAMKDKSDAMDATDVAAKEILSSGKAVGENTPEGKAPSSGGSDWTSWFSGWGFSTTVQQKAAEKPPEGAVEAEKKAKEEGKTAKPAASGGGGGAALGLGALALLLLSSK